MAKLRYPIGIQTFSSIINGNYAYVDKTMFIPKLLDAAKYVFLSRPRRFGKSLTLSMLHSYFSAERELFEGLAVSCLNVEWVKRPVIHFDFNASDYLREDGLETRLDASLSVYESTYGITSISTSLPIRFENVIRTAYQQTGLEVAILVDEYDKPLLGIEENATLVEKNQSTLKSFFGVLKSMDRYIHFAMLTGVARFNKVSIFNDLNNLRDISMQNDFADICGWTQTELEENYTAGIRDLAQSNAMSYAEAVEKLRRLYDGYKFASAGNRLYNPFSVLNALASGEFGSYWFQTGTPTFLAKRIIRNRVLLPSLNRQWVEKSELEAVGIHDSDPIPLLFQTGYLTIKSTDGNEYELHFPNEEVEFGFAKQLSRLCVPELNDTNGDFALRKFRVDLRNGDVESFMLRLQTMIKAIPYEQHNEKFYQNIVYLLFTLLGADARMEEHSSRGRADLVVRMEKYIYIFEFKYNGSAEEALQQIRDKDYAGRFNISDKEIILIGADFSNENRGLDSWLIARN
ncbi:MAG: ATP-binding protein [Muribaculaceae bacterium]|nr:ATP-binding protein [Muribaculaceae bacterium]